MVNQFLSGFERDFIQGFYDCPKCNEPITNPICHDCLGNEMAKWLNFYPNIKKKVMPKIKSFVREVNNEACGNLGCVACNKKKAALCPYCFTEAVYTMLKESKIDKMIIMDFLSTFNFDLKHEGYIQEAVKEGFY
jgi:hypothetical protein